MDWIRIKKPDLPEAGEVVLTWAKHKESECTGFYFGAIGADENVWLEYPSLDDIEVYAWKRIQGPDGQNETLYATSNEDEPSIWVCQPCGKWKLKGAQICHEDKCEMCFNQSIPVFPMKRSEING